MDQAISDEQGSALITVIAISALLSLLATVSFAVARNSIGVADAEEETHASLAAAEAGLDDYLFRLNTVDEYWDYNSVDLPPDGNLAFSPATCPAVPADCNWVPLPGGEALGEFTYSVDVQRLATGGVIEVTAHGQADDRIRSITASMKQESFLDYLYFTDFETLPPLVYPPADRSWAASNCNVHQWARPGGPRPTTGRPSNAGQGCIPIQFANNDRIRGPFHTNDTWIVSGNPEWDGSVSGSTPSDVGSLYTTNGASNPQFNGGPPFFHQTLNLPPSNTQIKIEADHTIGGDGCLFTGPTSVTLRTDGRVRIDSPYTRQSGPGCGSWTNNRDGAQIINIPSNGVIFVQAIPADPSDPNYLASGCPFGNNGLGYPIRRRRDRVQLPPR